MLDKIKSYWESLKGWFKHSETVLIARTEAMIGFFVTAIAAMDWSPLFSIFGTGTAFSRAELYGIGLAMLVKGIFGEWARRRNTIEVDNNLIPTSIVKEVKTEVVTDLPVSTTTTTDTVVQP